MTIEYNGKSYEAHDLLMKKKFALDIIEGRKTVEVRSFTDHYISRFLDKEVMKGNEKLKRKMDDPDWENEFKDIWCIHFHDYNNSWYLDVAIETVGMCIVDSQDIERLMAEYPGFSDLLEDAKKNDALPNDERPMIFYFVIDKVLATNLK